YPQPPLIYTLSLHDALPICLFFQIGVIASLLIVFFIMQTNFELNVAEFKQPTSNGIEEPPMIIYTIDVDKPKPAEPIKKVIEKRSEEHTSELQSRENLVCRL